jgi:hypothetical protein
MAFADIVKFTAGSSGTSDFTDGTAATGFRNLAGGAVSGQSYSYRAYSADLSQWENGAGIYNGTTIARTTQYETSTGSKVSFSSAPIVILTPLKVDLDAKFGSVVQLARNGSFAVAQRAMPTADNSYCLDGWRLLLENANGAIVTQDTADVPSGAGYACKLVVGSGNNGKFGIWSPLENKDMLSLRGGVVSLRAPLKATAGLVDGSGKIRIGIAQFTGTADAISSDPVTTWGAEGTNPTLATNWSFANIPVAIAVTTSWVDYLVENVSISASATNIAIMVWSDDRATTTTTDILRVGGYVTLTKGGDAPPAIVLPVGDEVAHALRYFEKSYNLGTTPGSVATPGTFGVFLNGPSFDGQSAMVRFATRKRTTPTVTLYSDTTGASVKVHDSAGGEISLTKSSAGEGSFGVTLYPLGAAASHSTTFHWTADADL